MRDAAIEQAILALLAERAPGKTICPSEVARALAQDNEAQWRPMMPAVRSAGSGLRRPSTGFSVLPARYASKQPR